MPFAIDSFSKYSLHQVSAKHLSLPEGDLQGRTVIVTGSNAGIGRAAALLLAKRNPARLILAVRNEKAGAEAAAEITEATQGRVEPEVWQLDMMSHTSVRRFARECEERLERLDVFIANAGIYPLSYQASEHGFQSGLQVNVISTLLLSELMIPILQRTAQNPLPGIPARPHLTINTSFTHTFVGELDGFEDGTMIQRANEQKAKFDPDCYQRGKAILMLAIPTLVQTAGPDILVTTADPGLVATNVMKEATGLFSLIVAVVGWCFARYPEGGALPIIWAALSPIKSGEYVADNKVTPPSALVRSDVDGSKSASIWKELRAIWGTTA